jgi:hypothetical protein
MYTPVAPPYNSIYIDACLEAVVKAASPDDWPKLYKCCIDDGFFVWDRDEGSLLAFLQVLNSSLPNVRLTWQYSQSSIDNMDLTVTKCMIGAGSVVPLKVTTHCIDGKFRVAFGKSSPGVRPNSLPYALRTVYETFPKSSRHFASSETFPVRYTNSLPKTP